MARENHTMKTLFQDCEGIIPKIAGQICERLLCIQVRNDEEGTVSPGVFWLKSQNGSWHRFFIDKSLYYLRWTEGEDVENDLDDEDFPVMDVGERFGLCNRKILKVEMSQIEGESEQEGCLKIYFDGGQILTYTCGERESKLTVL
jgi:hypothetical protein